PACCSCGEMRNTSWRHLSATPAQHAPGPPAALHAATGTRPHTASRTAHAKKWLPSQASSPTARRVVRVLPGDENRFWRSQVAARGAKLRWTMTGRVATSALHQPGAIVGPVHQTGNRKGNGEIDRHRPRDGLDGLAGLVERRVGHAYQVRVADGDRERGILRQVQVLWRE